MSCNSAVLSYRTSIGLNPKHDKHYSVKNPSHAEGPLRITTVIEHLKKCGLWSRCNIIEEHSAVDEGDLKETHSQSYIDSIVQLKNQPQELIDKFAEQFDTIYLRPESYEAAAEAVSCARNLATLIAEGKIPNGFALIRPPGHHAQKNEASGFCVFNNVAQAAEAAYNFGSNRILIVDFDVHHGQGIQQSFYEDKRYVTI
ncbi:unnamed protein product [Anisakis simplex]|uniref:Histone deacetylase 6 (inferred by orthology to a C. elegans protein) n=1 Tax=Anisakis simplex TaxID=6269 RepID=A0A0M3J1H1_ANISI|nr:unnamed protein product [Anisakis simplex]